MTILKAIIKPNNSLKVKFQKTDDAEIDHIVVQESNSVIHEDLRNEFNKLAVHVQKLCGFNGSVDDIEITGLTLKHGDKEGVVFKGKKKCGKRVLNFNSYFIDTVNEEYDLLSKMNRQIQQCLIEVEAYIENEKIGEGKTDLEDSDNEVD